MSSKDESTKGGLMVTDSYFEIAPALVSSPSSTPPAQSPITPYFEVVSEQCPDESGIQEHDSLACSMAELKLNEGPLRAGEARPISLSGKRTPSVQTQSTHKSEARPRLFAPAVLVQQDLEKRPDSSRARLGLRASIIRNADGAPWELKRQKIQQDLEKRPDSSRARLGLRASIIRNADAAPWEVNDEKRHRSDSLTNSSSPKHLLSKSLGIFGKV